MPLPFQVVTALGTGPLSMRLGRYHLSDSLGGGPTGEVYRAKVYGVAGLDREFAVKRFHPALVADLNAAGMIHSAARLYGALEHPRVARLHEVGEASGHTFVASEFVEGCDLAQLIDQGPLPAGTSAQLIVQVGRAVGYAHGRGLSHLGLCPTNIICTLRGDVKVTDFGFLPARLPRRPADDPTLLSRLCYLAPEQLEGQPTSPATDVYQLGVIAYQLMVGRKPYPQTEASALSHAMLSLAPAESGLGKHFEKVFQRALARSPFERFPDTGALADALEAALRSSPLPGSLADAGKAVSKRQSFLLSRRDSQASGALNFPMPSPPLALGEEMFQAVKTPPPVPTGGNKFGMIPTIITSKGAASPALSSAPFRGDTDVDATEVSGRAGSFSDQVTILEREHMADVPELSEDIMLGPAGTDVKASRGQFIGGGFADAPDDDAQTLIRDDSRPLSIDDQETLVKEDLGAVDSYSDPGGLRGPSSFDNQAFDDLDGIEDEVSEILAVPPGAPFAVEVPHLPTPGAGPLSGQHGRPREIPPAPAQHLSPPGQIPLVGKPANRGRSVFYLLLIAGLAASGFFGYGLLSEKGATSTTASSKVIATDASSLLTDSRDGAGAALLVDAGEASAADAERHDGGLPLQKDAGSTVQALPGDALEIDSNPIGAQIYLDGTLVGKTPIKLDPSDDNHRVAVIMPGYDLYTGDIHGQGVFKFDLTEVSPSEGPFGIKVRCVPRNKDRYYIYVDGLPVGQLCPSERIGVSKGNHEVEIYDPVTDSRRVFSVVAEDTSRSHRVLVD